VPTLLTVLDSWSNNSSVGTQIERQRFLKTHLTESDNVVEILLRLVRGERVTPFSQPSTIAPPSISRPLLAAFNSSFSYVSQQTHVSLAVLAMLHMAVDYSEKLLGTGKGKNDVEAKIGEIIRVLPSHLLYKSLDGMFKEWKAEKRGGR
jgi:20S proteasome subunit alpha 6